MSAFAYPIHSEWRSVALRDTPTRKNRSSSTHTAPAKAPPRNPQRVRVLRKTNKFEPFSFQDSRNTYSPLPLPTAPPGRVSTAGKSTRRRQQQQQQEQQQQQQPAQLGPDAYQRLVESITPEQLSDFNEPIVRTAEKGVTEEKKTNVRKKANAKTAPSDVTAQSDTVVETKHNNTKQTSTTKSATATATATATTTTTKKVTRKRRKPLKRSRSASIGASSSSSFKDSFQVYMNEISRNELLDQAEVLNLAQRIKSALLVERATKSLKSSLGRRPAVTEIAKNLSISPADVQRRLLNGTAAKNALVAANLRLVTSVARKVACSKAANASGLAVDDMVQEGSVGLIRAAEKFDASRGYRFSTYATWWIRAYVMRSITTQSRSIKVPSTIVDEYARIRKEHNRLREAGIFQPSDEEVAAALGITAAKLRFVVNVVTRSPMSLDISLGPNMPGSNSRSLIDEVRGDDNVEERMVENYAREELDKALKACLGPLERAVIRLRFGLEDGQYRTLRETGTMLGLSKERIRQVIFRALPKMKTAEFHRMLSDVASG